MECVAMKSSAGNRSPGVRYQGCLLAEEVEFSSSSTANTRGWNKNKSKKIPVLLVPEECHTKNAFCEEEEVTAMENDPEVCCSILEGPCVDVVMKKSPEGKLDLNNDPGLSDTNTIMETMPQTVSNSLETTTAKSVSAEEVFLEYDAALRNIFTENVVFTRRLKKNVIKISSSNFESSRQCFSFQKLECTCTSHAKKNSSARLEECTSSHRIGLFPNYTSKKKGRHRSKLRSQRAGRRWKPVPDEMKIDFNLSLFPRIGQTVDDLADGAETSIQKELELFEKSILPLKQEESGDDQLSHETNLSQSVEKVAEIVGEPNIKDEVDTDENCNPSQATTHEKAVEKNELQRVHNQNNNGIFVHEDYLDTVSYYEDKIPFQTMSSLECASFLAERRRLRVKKKWKKVKAHIQVKTKYCKSVGNCVHGQTFYIHFRVVQRMPMEIEAKEYRIPISIRRIDKLKGLSIKENDFQVTSNRSRKPNVAGRSYFAVDAYNADGDLPEDLVNILVLLQHRDLLPEDYDLLLRLDDRVKPKTVDAAILTELKTESFARQDSGQGICSICLDVYEVGQTIKHLPCGHYFHESCIDSWLSNSSMNCPLDATPVLLT